MDSGINVYKKIKRQEATIGVFINFVSIFLCLVMHYRAYFDGEGWWVLFFTILMIISIYGFKSCLKDYKENK